MTWARLDDVTIRYEVSGGGTKDIVLLHELGGSLESFDGVVGALDGAFRILRYDQRGAGLSEKPRRAFTQADHVADLSQLMAAAGFAPPYRFAGVAAGAAIAVGFALDHPAAVDGLALCAPALTVAPDRNHYLTERSMAAMRDGMAAIVDATLDRSYPEIVRRDRAIFDAYRGRFLANDPVGYAHANLALAGSDLEDRLGDLRMPCLVVAGLHDLLRPPSAVEPLARRIADADYAVIDSGHLMPVQAPHELAARLHAFFARPQAVSGAS
ncbi:MAG TPA: alpha/beta hydrolase [Stellaceae bacterium]|nr:alpha/beta hydrolase [Stellaceae bacterium]